MIEVAMDDLVARVAVAVADPELAEALARSIGDAMRAVAAEPRPTAPIEIVRVTRATRRELVARIDAARAAGAAGVQLVWDGRDARLERHVFAALEHARATPAAAPVVLAPDDTPAAALLLVIARRSTTR